jgi:hypothetical protein
MTFRWFWEARFINCFDARSWPAITLSWQKSAPYSSPSFCGSLFCCFHLLGGHAFGGDLAIPFLYDIEVQVRFLVVVPLMIASEIMVHERLRAVRTHFLDRKLIPEALIPKFEKCVESAYKLRNSFIAEILIICLCLRCWRQRCVEECVAVSANTWYSVASDGARS